ncbi:hypothetical protein F973_00728 [Acinetobacter sp. CIP 102129]|nr:hypothetical protein F973_00728 [Acinetobacter sp. CIP 102129]
MKANFYLVAIQYSFINYILASNLVDSVMKSNYRNPSALKINLIESSNSIIKNRVFTLFL